MASRRNGLQNSDDTKFGSNSSAGVLSASATNRRATVPSGIWDKTVAACARSSSKLKSHGTFRRLGAAPYSNLRSETMKARLISFFAIMVILGLTYHFLLEEDEDILAIHAELEKIPKKMVPSPKALRNPKKTAWANDDDVNEDSRKGENGEAAQNSNEDDEADDDDQDQAVHGVNGMIWGKRWSTQYDDDTVKNKDDPADTDDDDKVIEKEEAKAKKISKESR